MIHKTDVLVVGAGPTGLVLGLWLTLLGVRVRIIDKTSEAGTTSRAVAVQARTLELYRQIGLADAVVAGGRKVPAVNLWVAGKQVAHASLSDMGAGISPFPYALIYPQDEHERLLIDRLAQTGVEVERETERRSRRRPVVCSSASSGEMERQNDVRSRMSPAATAHIRPSGRPWRSASRAADTAMAA
jgi:2-polyprenyl-6-methoxyphenol hydroxylase-like FAD-dependent oxidoreductase